MARPRRFDESALLDVSTDLFWSNGFDGTSIEEISAVTGVANGSIYAAYGSKLGFFLALFTRYCERRTEFVLKAMDSPGSAASAVSAYFEAVIADCATQPGRRGCLMINSVAQLGGKVPEVVEIARKSTERMEAGVAARIRAATSVPDDDEIAALSSHVILVSQGLIHSSRLGLPESRLRDMAATSCTLLPAYCAA